MTGQRDALVAVLVDVLADELADSVRAKEPLTGWAQKLAPAVADAVLRGWHPHPCPVCGGAGIVDTSPPGVEHTAPWLLTDTDCPRCGGSGEIDPTTYEPDIEES